MSFSVHNQRGILKQAENFETGGESTPVTIAILDGEELSVLAWEALVHDLIPGSKVVWSGTSALHLLNFVESSLKSSCTDVDAVILDPTAVASPLSRELVSRLSEMGIKVVVLADRKAARIARSELLNGASYIVFTDSAEDDLRKAILGDGTDSFAIRSGVDVLRVSSIPKFSKRELQVIELYAEGFKVSEISRKLSISVDTCKEYIKRIRATYTANGRDVTTKGKLIKVAHEDYLLKDGQWK